MTTSIGFDIYAKDRASAVFNNVGDSATRSESKISKFGKMAAVGLAAAGAGAIVGAKHFFGLSASLEQMEMKSATVFGGQLGMVDKWADKNAAAMGLTGTQATGLAANFADLLIPMGFTRKAAAGMSTDVVGLSGALSQWSGGTVSAAEASDVLAKAMLGERDGLKALGISISDADVKARLLKNGQNELTGAALQQAQAQATQQLIMEKSTDAQAAYAAGGSPLLTSQAKLKAVFGEVQEKIAVGLMPAFASVGDWILSTGIPAMERFAGALKVTANFVKENSTVLSILAGALGTAFVAFKALMFIRNVTAAVAAFNIMLAANPIGLVVVAIAGLVTALVIAYRKSETFREIVQGSMRAVGGAFTHLLDVARNAFGAIQDRWMAFRDFVGGWKDAITGRVSDLFGGIREAWSTARAWVDERWGAFKAWAAGLTLSFSGAFDGLGVAFRSAVNAIISAWNNLSFGIPSFDPPGPGKFPGVTVSTPNVPFLAEGGIVRQPTMAVVGESGPEAVIPLSRLGKTLGGSGQVTYNFTINDATDPQRTVEAIRSYVKRNGPLRNVTA